MHRLSPLLLLALVGLFASACQPADTTESDASEAAQLTTPVEGVWNHVEVSFTSADTSYTNEITRPMLLIFSKGHYAALRIAGEPRELLPEEEDPSDDQRLAALRGVRMNGGTYEVSDSSMTTTVIMHHNPNVMAEGPSNTTTFEVDGDVMTRTFTNEEDSTQTVVKFERWAEAPPTAVEGVWKTVEVSFSSADTSYTNEITRPMLLIFSKGHYAALRIAGEPRELLPDEEDPSDEQRLAALRGVRMNGGTYEVSGSSMTTTVIMHHNPNVMAEGPSNTSTFEVDGDVMTRTFTNEVRQLVVKYERRE